MADDLLQVLTRFHREVIAPDLDRRDEKLGTVEQKLDDVLTHFDAIYHRFDQLESEYQALAAAVGRLERQMEAMPKVDIRREIDEIKARVAQLQERIEQLESTRADTSDRTAVSSCRRYRCRRSSSSEIAPVTTSHSALSASCGVCRDLARRARSVGGATNVVIITIRATEL
jgi:DNA repair exonuclease SbcCD ATPase subunit